MTSLDAMDHRLLPKSEFDALLRLLAADGFEVIGPRLDQHAIVYGPLSSARELPVGWTDRQAPGSYRLEKRADESMFGYVVGPQSWKKYLFPPAIRLWSAQKTDSGFAVLDEPHDPPKRAFLGVRSCELHAIAIQDRVFLDRAGQFTDPYYALARERLFLIAVECEYPGGNCFCTSLGTGPDVRLEQFRQTPAEPGRSSAARTPLPLVGPAARVQDPCDLVLTELDDAFTVRAVSAAGEKLLDRLQLSAASASQIDEARQRIAKASQSMGRTVDLSNVRSLLSTNSEHPRWDDVAQRCMACTNCTLVCPTCFCSSTVDDADLTGTSAERSRHWDSCFNPEFARVHGGNFRPSIRGRYRQWLTHKFASWFDQFDTSGCVGCGRCITWCPVGIDVTEEITAIGRSPGQTKENRP